MTGRERSDRIGKGNSSFKLALQNHSQERHFGAAPERSLAEHCSSTPSNPGEDTLDGGGRAGGVGGSGGAGVFRSLLCLDFAGGPVVMTLCFCCRERRFDP